MKKIVALLLFCFLFAPTFAQKDVYFKITHKLGNSPYNTTQVSTNNNNNTFKLTRLEYYIAEIKLTHDGGNVTTIPNKWILANADQTVNEYLGNLSITNLESVSFGIGVESAVNHLDPLTYAASHPLATQLNSMHWGWSAGYRFVALEGLTGPSNNAMFQIHALGDNNYFTQSVSTTGYLSGNDIIIDLQADYQAVLNNIIIDGNLFNHGETGEAATLLLNFNSTVFSQNSTGISELTSNHFSISPNPSNGKFNVALKAPVSNGQIRIFNLTGSLVQDKFIQQTGKISISLDEPGMYLMQLIVEGKIVGAEKLTIY